MKGFIFTILLCIISIPGHGGSVESLLDDYWQWFLQQFPEYATTTGEYRWNGRRQSYNISVYATRQETVQRFNERLHSIHLDNPSPTEQRSYDLLDYNLHTYLDGYQWFLYGAINPVSFMEGPHRDINGGIGQIPILALSDLEDCFSRIAATRTQLSEITYLMRTAIALGRTLHNVSMSRVPSQIDKILVDDPRNSSIFQKLTTGLEQLNVSDSYRETLRNRALQIIQDDFLEPYREFKDFITQEYMPNSRAGYGVDSWSNGREYYKSCLKWHLSADKTPQQIHQLGLEEVSRISQEMYKIMKGQSFQGSISEYFTILKNNPVFQFQTSEEITQEYTRLIKERIDPELNRIFSDIPKLPVVVKASFTEGGFAYYQSGKPDGSTPGIFWINTLRPSDTYSFDMLALAAHEANPGHHLQISYSMKQDLPMFRKFVPYVMYSSPFNFPSYTAYKEGWALYAETLLQELGVYQDDYELMGRYASEIFRACRLVVDTGLHAFGWSKQRAIEYMMNYTSFSYSKTEDQVDRYITWPGQACSYKFGELKLRELKRRAENTLGNRFDVKKFHAAILDLGPSSMEMVENAVDDLILRTVKASGSQRQTICVGLLTTSIAVVALFLSIAV